VITEKHRFILFGTYPYEEHWRRRCACCCSSALHRLRHAPLLAKELALVWIGVLTLIGALMWGGVFGLSYVPQERWGGLSSPSSSPPSGWPSPSMAIMVALGRRSSLPAIKALCVVYVELIRGVPLISLLFMASVMFPLFLPEA
jgi:general L-amino acid transport system permease protein